MKSAAKPLGRFHEFTLAEAIEIGTRNDPGPMVPSTSRVLIKRLAQLEDQAEKARALVEKWVARTKSRPENIDVGPTRAQQYRECADELAAIYKEPSHD